MVVGKLEGGVSILGIDFLKKYVGIVDLRDEILHIGKQIFPPSPNPKHVQTCARIKLSDTVKIRTEFYCKGYIQGKLATE